MAQTMEDQPDFVCLGRHYICSHCGNVLVNPMQAKCGHRFCENCIDDLLKEGNEKKCPADDGDCANLCRKDIHHDVATRREIKTLAVHCPNKSLGCNDNVKWKDLKEHLITCSWQKRFQHCNSDQSQKGNQEIHKQLKKALAVMYEKKRDLSLKEDELKKVTVDRDLLRGQDQTASTQNKKLKGKLSALGNEKNSLKPLHDTKEETTHQKDLERSKKQLTGNPKPQTDAFSLTENKEHDSEIQNVAKEKDELRMLQHQRNQELDIIRTEIKQLHQLTNEMQLTIVQHETHIGMLEKRLNLSETWKITEKLNIMEENISKLEHLLTLQMRTFQRNYSSQSSVCGSLIIHDGRHNGGEPLIRSIQTPLPPCDGKFLWVIEHYSELKIEATSGDQVSLQSAPFYTAPYGYKLCAKVYLYGNGIGERTHISLFISLMQGTYDAMLPWPFEQKITCYLMEQSTRGRHIKKSVEVDDNISLVCMQRPQTKANASIGFPKFVSHTDVESPIHSYLNDDKLFIKISVESFSL